MAFYLRFYHEGPPSDAGAVRAALAAADAKFSVTEEAGDALLAHADDPAPFALLSFCAPGDGIFEEEREEQLELLPGEIEDPEELEEALGLTRAAEAAMVAQLLQGGEGQDSDARLDTLWHWAFATLGGVLQVDGEGAYTGMEDEEDDGE